MARLSPEQQQNVATILRVGRQKGASKKVLKAALEAGLVESNLRNLGYGDRDSVGVFQQRPSAGWTGLTNVAKAAGEFYDHAIPLSQKYGSAGQLAQAVQRSAFPGRYDQRSGDANSLLSGVRPTPSSTATAPPATAGNQDAVKKQIALSLLGFGDVGGADPLTLALTQAARQRSTVPSGPQPTGNDIAAVVARAGQINSEHLPYKWGGGHGSAPAGPGVPLDCSGAVSRLLGVSPRVSGDFTKYGKAGNGKAVTVYANGSHVLLEIKGHFWGTSASNPGGGAGWIPRKQISSQYLKNFTARHPNGM